MAENESETRAKRSGRTRPAAAGLSASERWLGGAIFALIAVVAYLMFRSPPWEPNGGTTTAQARGSLPQTHETATAQALSTVERRRRRIEEEFGRCKRELETLVSLEREIEMIEELKEQLATPLRVGSDPCYQRLLSKAKEYEEGGDRKDALMYYYGAARVYPDYSKGEEAHFRAGECLMRLGRYGAAMDRFNTVIERFLDGTFEARARMSIAKCLMAINLFPRARMTLYALAARAGVYRAPEDMRLVREVYYRLAECYFEEAQQLKQSIELADD